MKIDGIDLDPGNLTQDLLQLLVGERWPNGDEGAMRSLATAWSQAAEQINEIRQTATAAAKQVQQYCQGENGESFQSYWSASFDDGQSSWPAGQAPAALPFAEVFCQSMSQALNSGANQIETTKDTIMGNIAILVATVAPQIAAGFFDFGATDATAAAEIAADRTAMEVLLDGAKELIGEVVKQAFEQGLQQAELNFLIQVKEVAEGHASGIDWKQVGSSGLSGAEGGALGAGFGFGLGKAGAAAFGKDFGKSFLGKAATGVVSGQLTNASIDLIQNGSISASDFTKGSLAGVLGGLGGADAAGRSGSELHLETPAIDEPTATGDHPATLDTPAVTDLSGLDLGRTDLHTGTTPGDAGISADAGISGNGVDRGNGVDPSATQGSVSAGTDVTGVSSIARILGGGDSGRASGGGVVDGGGSGGGASGGGYEGSPDGSYGSRSATAEVPASRGYETPTVTSGTDRSFSAYGDTATSRGTVDSGISVDAATQTSGAATSVSSGSADVHAGSDTTFDAGAAPSQTSDTPAGFDSASGMPSGGGGRFADTGGVGGGVVDGGGSRGSMGDRAPASEPTSELGGQTGADSGRVYGSRDGQGLPTSRADGFGGTREAGRPIAGTEPTRVEATATDPVRVADRNLTESSGLDRLSVDPNGGEPRRVDPAAVDPRAVDPNTARPNDTARASDGPSPNDGAKAEAPARPEERPQPDSKAQPSDPSKPAPDGARPEQSQNPDQSRPADRAADHPADRPADPAPDRPSDPAPDRPADPTPQAPWSPPVPLSEHVADLNSRAEHSDHGLSLFSDPVMADLARRVPPDPGGAYDVNLHTDATGGVSGLDRVTGRDIADLALADGVRPPQKIRITGCEAGALSDGLAAEVSRLTGCDVVAADSLVWSDEAGHMFASRGTTDGFGRPAPDIPPNGNWHEFHPDGTSTPVGDGGFPPGQESGFGNWHAPVGETRARSAEPAAWDPPEPRQTREVPDPSDPSLRPLEPGERFSDRTGLPRSAKIEVTDTDDRVRGTFYTDENGKITHAELPVPNVRHGQAVTPQHPKPYTDSGLTEQNVIDGSNLDAATPPGDAVIKYISDDHSIVLKTDSAGEPQPPAVWDANASLPVKEDFTLGPQQSVFGIDPAKLEPNSHYTAQQTPAGETAPRTTDFWTDGSGRIVAVDTWRGRDTPASAKGGWNPNLGSYGQAKGPGDMRFQPGVTFRVDGKVGVTDDYGRVTTMSLDNGAVVQNPLTPSVRNESAQSESNSMGQKEYPAGQWDGGHKYPAAVGGPSEPFNYFPQDRASNQGNGPGAADSWYKDEMDTVAGVAYHGAAVSGWDIIESHATGTPGDPAADPPTPPSFNKTPEMVIVRKTYRFPQPDGTLGPPRTTIRFITNVKP